MIVHQEFKAIVSYIVSKPGLHETLSQMAKGIHPVNSVLEKRVTSNFFVFVF